MRGKNVVQFSFVFLVYRKVRAKNAQNRPNALVCSICELISFADLPALSFQKKDVSEEKQCFPEKFFKLICLLISKFKILFAMQLFGLKGKCVVALF